MNVLTLFDKQYEYCLTITGGISEKTIKIYFYPIIDYGKNIPENLKGYHLDFTIILWYKSTDERYQYINENLIVNVPHKELDKLINTIKSV